MDSRQPVDLEKGWGHMQVCLQVPGRRVKSWARKGDHA
jgi:hypothetical protein